jgi:hypothetical protein
MHSRETVCPLDLSLDTPQEDVQPNIIDYAEDLTIRLKLAFQLVEKHVKTQVQRMKRDYDASVRSKAFRANDLVWYYYPRRYKGRSSKLSRYYVGPYRIVAVLNDVNYVLKATPRSKAVIAHIEKLRFYYRTIPTRWKTASTASNQTEDIGQTVRNITAETNHKLVSNAFSDQRKSLRVSSKLDTLHASNSAPRSEGDERTRFRPSRLRRPPQRYGW